MGKLIYKPKGKAGEYAKWACNLYNGCSNGCEYCYLRRGVLASVMGGRKPELKKGIRTTEEAFRMFIDELVGNIEEILKEGLFFSFSTDPCLPETRDFTFKCIDFATGWKIPCTILTKRADWVLESEKHTDYPSYYQKYLKIGFTLTGCDEMESGASSNLDRIKAMRILHEKGFKTFASIEPVIDFDKSLDMIRQSLDCCDEYKIGLLSGKKDAYLCYNMPERLQRFVDDVNALLVTRDIPVYYKRSVETELMKINK